MDYSKYAMTFQDDLTDSNMKKSRRAVFWKQMFVILGTVFTAECSRGLVVPSLYLYVNSLSGNPSMVAFIVSAYSFGRFTGSIALGWAYNKSGARTTVIISLAFSIIGNFMYVLGPLTNIWIVFASRVLSGFGTGILSSARAFIAERTTEKQRTKFVAYSNAAQFVGFAIVPGFAAVLSYVNLKLGPITIDSFTSPGLVLVFLNIALLVVTLTLLPRDDYLPSQEESALKGVHVSMRIFYIGLALFISLNFIARGILSSLETLSSPLFLDAWKDTDNDEVQDTALMLLCLGVIGLFMFFLVDYIAKLISERKLLILSFCILSAGCIVLIDFSVHDTGIGLVQFLIGAVLIWSIASPILQTLIISAFSKILGSKPQVFAFYRHRLHPLTAFLFP